jgi:cell division protein FtsW (lipid II flippase)
MLATRTRPATDTTPARLGDQMSVVLVAAFVLSAAHTTYGSLVGLADPRFTVTTPLAWVFYAFGFALAVVARSRRRTVQATVVTSLVLLLVVAVFWYPTTFEPRQQTAFGWFENDVYTGLLMIALYLGVLQLWRPAR